MRIRDHHIGLAHGAAVGHDNRVGQHVIQGDAAAGILIAIDGHLLVERQGAHLGHRHGGRGGLWRWQQRRGHASRVGNGSRIDMTLRHRKAAAENASCTRRQCGAGHRGWRQQRI